MRILLLLTTLSLAAVPAEARHRPSHKPAQPSGPGGVTVDHPDKSTGERGETQQKTDPNGQPCLPPGYNTGVGGYPECPPDYAPTQVPCSKSQTDSCVQTYERPPRSV
jgi:hypothetical protein